MLKHLVLLPSCCCWAWASFYTANTGGKSQLPQETLNCEIIAEKNVQSYFEHFKPREEKKLFNPFNQNVRNTSWEAAVFLQAQISSAPGFKLENPYDKGTYTSGHILNFGGLPFEDESNDKVGVDSDPPIALFPRGVRLGVVRRQNYA